MFVVIICKECSIFLLRLHLLPTQVFTLSIVFKNSHVHIVHICSKIIVRVMLLREERRSSLHCENKYKIQWYLVLMLISLLSKESGCTEHSVKFFIPLVCSGGLLQCYVPQISHLRNQSYRGLQKERIKEALHPADVPFCGTLYRYLLVTINLINRTRLILMFCFCRFTITFCKCVFCLSLKLIIRSRSFC